MIRTKFVFNRKNKLNKFNEALVQLEVYIDRSTRRYFSTNIYVGKEFWDATNCQIKTSHFNHLIYNQQLRDLKKSVEDFAFDCARSGVAITDKLVEWHITNFLNGEKVDPIEITFNDFCRDCWKEDFSKLKEGSSYDLQRTLDILDCFNPNVRFEELNYNFIRDWDNYLHSRNYEINTIWKNHKNLRRYVNIAVKSGFVKLEDYPYRDFRLKQEKTKRVDLTLDEISRIEELEYGNPYYMAVTRDTFLFSCYTGLRFSDIMALRTGYLSRTKDGVCIELEKMIKVRKPVFLPIEVLFKGKAAVILKKYIGEEKFEKIGTRIEDHLIFPTISNQEVNRYLKILAHDANINKHLTYHVSRHSFGTNMADLTGDVFLIMDLMGISKQDTAMIYIHSSKERTTEKLKKIAW